MITFSWLFTPWGKRSSYGLMGLFFILICVAVFDMQKQFRENHFSIKNTPVNQTENNPRVRETSMEVISKIPAQHLFGKATLHPTGDVPISSLQLQLIGILAGLDDHTSRVIISEAGGLGKIYRVGDNVGSIRINAVTPNGVILENSGRLEKLPLKREVLTFQGMPKKLLNGA